MLGLATGAQAQTCTDYSNAIGDPPTFEWTDAGGHFTGTLELGEATFCIGGETLTTRAYRQFKPGLSEAEQPAFSIPGPTLNMSPGETYVVTFKNSLPYEGEPSAHNEFGDPNISNLHTHGLHVSGESPADDVTRIVNGGECGDYVYEIPADHMGGTLWYHAHHHGSTYLQVAGGAFGMMIIDDSNDVIPSTVAGMSERLLAIAFLDPNAAGTGGDVLMTGSMGPTWTTNGVVGGAFTMPEKEWEHWRILLADRDAKEKTLSVGPTCEVELLARDGVWRTVAPKPLETNSIDLNGASRADLAVRCTGDSTISVNGTTVANVTVGGTGNAAVGPYDEAGQTWSALRPNYLRDLRGTIPTAYETINMGARTVNGSKFDITTPTFEVRPDGVQEWLVKGATNHPFHLHVYHMQMNGACGSYEDGEYYDTIAANGCLVRFDANPETSTVYKGRTIMHCHILDHEDQGAMGWVDVLDVPGTIPPPAFPNADPPYQLVYGCSDGGGTEPPPPPPPSVDCTEITDRNLCRAESQCTWSGKNKTCGPA
jgi:FtsP/CotA-like multicopper oxidase with cupredoxin domain